jgi:hypothetical protein
MIDGGTLHIATVSGILKYESGDGVILDPCDGDEGDDDA